MPFASQELAARIERAECGLLVEGARAAARRRGGPEPFMQAVAGGVATLGVPGSPLNKLAGLGFAGVPDLDDLARIERAFDERGVPVQAELSTLADPGVGELLTRRGYVLRVFENVSGLALPAEVRLRASDAVVSAAAAGDLDAWIDTVVTGFASPDTRGAPSHEDFPRDVLVEAMRDMAAMEGFLRFDARRAGALAGGASLRLEDGVAQLCGAATLPEHRRRGVQSALLAARLAFAADAGCDVAVLTTQPGSTSQENAHRQGFVPLYARAVLVREAP